MKTIGLIGGMSWESTIPYYRVINQSIKAQLGGLHSAKILLLSVDFAEIAALQSAGEWHVAGEQLAQAARTLQSAGAECLVLCTNTMHKVADQITAATDLPFLHIADVTASHIKQANLSKIGLLGTRFTMEQDFYIDRLVAQQIEVIVPELSDRLRVNEIIFNELCQGQIHEASRQVYREVMHKLVAQGAQGVILGCTEIALLVNASDAAVPLFDTADLHAQAVANFALK
ncbi:aspartate/glutamate racemase family protein [Chitinibacter fontanus]|uniref:Aspartate/glutamate racemase family protein n=1 Tax=Chitinibacter fontanus TaxID=1737446 RepID=A0A7D5VB01_9NEIS|nr:aspartate/glutamate racemase family protein [Chitinibacter fontanus]QLI82416.1 aspartate/glutamate racemase family protein [Chitinibacter fontanus]